MGGLKRCVLLVSCGLLFLLSVTITIIIVTIIPLPLLNLANNLRQQRLILDQPLYNRIINLIPFQPYILLTQLLYLMLNLYQLILK